MQFKTLIASAFMAAVASGHGYPRGATRSCGTPGPTESQKEAARNMLEMERQRAASGELRGLQAFTVQTYFHVIAASETVEDGYITQQMVDDQFAVLSEAFAPNGVSFNLVSTDWTIDEAWADDSDELAYKEALRQGTYSDLNIYFLRTPNFGALGYCYFPDNVEPGSPEFYQDGCVIMAASVPGGSAAPYNLGGTAPHEVGHWMNLWHTFQDGCTGGDFVDDTPAQASPSSGCPDGRDSCPAAGLDPIHNFMDYSDDACYTEFTAGQQERMFSSWETFRQ